MSEAGDSEELDESEDFDEGDDSDAPGANAAEATPPLIVQVPSGQFAARLDKLLADSLPELTRGQIQRWILDGRVSSDGQILARKDKPRPGMRIEVRPGPGAPTRAEPDPDVRFEVLHEDAELIVVDKPAGLVVHPGRGHPRGTLVNGLLARSGFERPPSDPRDPAGQLRPGVVHRIDKDTSGILVVAKTESAREGLKEQFAEHSIERSYLALSIGVPREGVIDTLHGRDPGSRLRFSSRVPRGKRAVTRVRVLERLAQGRAAFIECRLETGRTHQIRMHLSGECATPLLADELYGGLRGPPELVEIGRALGRQALHAAVLGFRHPQSGQVLRFEAALPADLQEALTRLRALG